MNSKDRLLGMDRPIDRRDFLNGTSVAIGASLLAACAGKTPVMPEMTTAPAPYPPARTGMRGSHPGSFEGAHAAVEGENWRATNTGEEYDLIIVGAGISGLSAAHIYLRDVDANARILILDNHDDFGGHAKRNEFKVDGKKLIAYGGTMYVTAPHTYPEVSKQVIRELGIDQFSDRDYRDNSAFSTPPRQSATFFDKETFGKDHLAIGDLTSDEVLADLPLSEKGKEDLKRLIEDETNYLADMTPQERREIIYSISWGDYLKTYAGVGEEVMAYFQSRPEGVWAIGADALPAWLAYDEGYPGFAEMDLGFEEEEPEVEEGSGGGQGGSSGFRFPDGNATVARLLVRRLIPGSANGTTMQDIVPAALDYGTLDRSNNQTRIRLSSIVISMGHINGNNSRNVEVTYLNNGSAKTVTGKRVIWAGYHALLPYICSDIPESQIEALSNSVRAPLVYTNVAIRNSRSFANLGIRRVRCPGSFFNGIGPTHNISIGGYEFAKTPDDPVVLFMTHIPLAAGLPAPEQFRMGRYKLLETPFETFERNIRDQLGRVLGPGGFDPAHDIAGITVNRWPHGYAYSIDPESNDVAYYPDDYWPHERKPWVEARARVGNIAIAGTDAASNAMTESAIEEAHRAVHSF